MKTFQFPPEIIPIDTDLRSQAVFHSPANIHTISLCPQTSLKREHGIGLILFQNQVRVDQLQEIRRFVPCDRPLVQGLPPRPGYVLKRAELAFGDLHMGGGMACIEGTSKGFPDSLKSLWSDLIDYDSSSPTGTKLPFSHKGWRLFSIDPDIAVSIDDSSSVGK